MYTSVYTASTQSCTWQVGLQGRVHGPRRHVTAVGRVHGRNAPCTRSCTRPIHSRVNVRLHGPCTRPRTRTVCRNGPHTAVACRLRTCSRPGRPTCGIHGPDGPCTRPCNSPYTAVHTRRYTTVYGRGDGRFRSYRWPVHGRVHGPCTSRHVDTCTRPYTCRVHGHVHGPYMAVYTSRVRGRLCAMYTAEDVRTVMYTGGVDGPCARPIHGRVYGTAVIQPCTGRFRGRRRVRGPCTRRPCNGHTTRYTAVYTTRYTAVYTAGKRPHNGRLHGRGRPVHGRVTAV